jgi:transposase InsO family protein
LRRRSRSATSETPTEYNAKWVDWWYQRRLHSAAGHVSPAEFEVAHYDAINAVVPAA